MTIDPTNNVNSSSSVTLAEMTEALSTLEKLPPLELVLSYIKEDMSSSANGERGIRNRGPRRYLIGNEDDDDDDDSNSFADEKGTSIFDPITVSDDSFVDWTFDDKKLVSWRNTKHEPSSDSPSEGNVYVPSASDVFSEDIDTISNALDIAFAKDISISKSSAVANAPDTVVNEEDFQERSNKAAFVQELVINRTNNCALQGTI